MVLAVGRVGPVRAVASDGRGMTQRRYATLFARLVANTREPDNESACWIWTGAVGTNGRPRVNVRRNGKHCSCSAHRLMLGIFYALDAEAEASHLCSDSWLCINPDHLLPETKQQNMARRWGRPLPAGRTWPGVAANDPDHAAGEVVTVCPF